MNDKYMVLGTKNDNSPNIEVFYATDSETELKEVYLLLLRLNDLKYPETEALAKEHKELRLKLSEEYSVCIFTEEETEEYGEGYSDWNITGVYTTEKLDVSKWNY